MSVALVLEATGRASGSSGLSDGQCPIRAPMVAQADGECPIRLGAGPGPGRVRVYCGHMLVPRSLIRRTAFAVAVASVLAAASACSPSPNPPLATTPVPTASAPGGVESPEPSTSDALEGIQVPLAAGEIPLTIPDAWGTPEAGPRADEGYVLQDLTWAVPGPPQGTVALAVAMTPSQAELLSGGSGFNAHVEGMADLLTFDGTATVSVDILTIRGAPAARLEVIEGRDTVMVVYLYDLGDAYYEFGLYAAPGEVPSPAQLADFDAVANSLTMPQQVV